MTLDYIYHSGFAIEAGNDYSDSFATILRMGSSSIITKILRKLNITGESYMTTSCKDRVNSMYWPLTFTPTTSTVKY